MDTWTTQKGYPVVTVSRTGVNKLSVKQNWFLLNPLNTVQGTPEYDKYKWWVPFTYYTKEKLDDNFESRPQWLAPNQSECTFFFLSFL